MTGPGWSAPGALRRARRAGATLLAVLGVILALGASAPGAAQDGLEALRGRIQEIMRGSGGASAEWSVLAVSLDTGDTLYASGPANGLAPASNMKLATTAAALHYLGSDYRYQTFVLADGTLLQGRLEGDLVLYGTGDPGISDRFFDSRTAVFESLADQLLEAGVREVTGDVVGDGSYFEGPLLADGWDPRDLNDWFAASAGALSYNENVVTLRVEPGSSNGAPPVVHTLPADAAIPIQNTATTGRGRLRIRREHPSQPVEIDGAVPRGGREVWRQITVGDPARFAAQVFANVLNEKGIRVSGVRTVTDPGSSTLTGRRLWVPSRREATPRILAVHESPPIQEYLAVVNKRSHNLLAELTLKTIGRVTGGGGSYQGGGQAVQRFLAEAGVDTSQTSIVDGSGLSGQNRFSSGAFIGLLAHMAESDLWDAYWESLPEAGNPRELRRMYRTPAAGNLRAKTGTIEKVSALSGVVTSAAGERIAFSIIGNSLSSTWGAKRVEDEIGVQLASFDRPFEPRDTRLAAAATDAPPGGAGSTDSATTLAGVETGAAPMVGGADTGEASREEAPAKATHMVQKGENFTVIARKHRVTLNALTEANPGVSSRSLQPGMRLTVPGEAAEDDGVAPQDRTDPVEHRVAAGENFTVIARKYGVSVNELINANPNVQPNRMQAGQTLKIPTGAGNDGH